MRLYSFVLILVLFCGCINNPVKPTLSDQTLRDLQGCEKNVDGEYGQDECYWSLGIEGNSPEICGRINDSRYRDDCFWNVGIALGDATICGKILDQYPRLMCEAVAQKNPGICDRIGGKSGDAPEQGKIDVCHALVGRDPDFCVNASNPDGCYFMMSRLLRNRTLCEGIRSAPSQYGLCVRSFNNKD
jgi:hypothetical protein